MAKMYVWHKVADFNKWKSVFDSMHSLRKDFGCTDEHVFRGAGDPNELVVITQWENKDQATKYGQSQELKEGMQKAGVVSKPDIAFAE